MPHNYGCLQLAKPQAMEKDTKSLLSIHRTSTPNISFPYSQVPPNDSKGIEH